MKKIYALLLLLVSAWQAVPASQSTRYYHKPSQEHSHFYPQHKSYKKKVSYKGKLIKQLCSLVISVLLIILVIKIFFANKARKNNELKKPEGDKKDDNEDVNNSKKDVNNNGYNSNDDGNSEDQKKEILTDNETNNGTRK